jgi:purine-nucleoside phosphorylase
MIKYKETLDYIKSLTDIKPIIGLVLGSGLGDVANDMDIKATIPYKDIPGFLAPTIEGHSGNLIFGYLETIPVVAMQGRNHYYEGHTMQQITYPIRIMKLLGIERLITSNATGGMNERYEIGDVMFVNDHINLMGDNPLIGPNDESMGVRFLDVSRAYDSEMIDVAKKFAVNNNIIIHEGVLAAVSGPNYETPAEYKYMRIIGADAVGMSTIPEVLVARHMGVKVFSMSLITDLGIIGKIVEITHEEVQRVANESASKMSSIVKHLVSHFGK